MKREKKAKRSTRCWHPKFPMTGDGKLEEYISIDRLFFAIETIFVYSALPLMFKHFSCIDAYINAGIEEKNPCII
jgi:hypothetical protein